MKLQSAGIIIALFTLFFAVSCKRIHKRHPEMVGKWGYMDKSKSVWVIEISKNSWGTVTVYDSTGKDLEYNGENGRYWRYNEKNGSLHNGMISPNFDIDQFPAVAETLLNHKYDTVHPGETYCIINGGYYHKVN
jgi:hypothetical protein